MYHRRGELRIEVVAQISHFHGRPNRLLDAIPAVAHELIVQSTKLRVMQPGVDHLDDEAGRRVFGVEEDLRQVDQVVRSIDERRCRRPIMKSSDISRSAESISSRRELK